MQNDSFKTSTGIQIGIMYVNRTSLRPLEDPDMLLLQEALVRTGASKMYRKSTKYMQRASLISGILLGFLIVISIYLDARYPL